MLSVKNLVKVYKTKGGAEVRALDGVSVDFPETGMVFLLGKSGSGKSTLLNMAGGLDRPDDGEIIIKGKSSKDFSSNDFDSYRNTFIGFVFQEYNILGEFNVEQNIALALQLQGKKNDVKTVNDLLKQVDLEGLGRRKPNTLSGGQKQRIAIARALIKEPEIIMADEPTGALDSKTGQQVFDTLKKLSATKLVIVVSHDRDFAEYYADRIIELKDGKIISDVSKTIVPATSTDDGNIKFIGESTIKIEDIEKVSESDLKDMLSKMKNHGKTGVISFGEQDVNAIKKTCKIRDDDSKESFENTDTETIAEKVKSQDTHPKFIKSKLPAKRAIKLGLSGLKTKPIRLIFTILLAVISFTLFGTAMTMVNFDPAYSVGVALEDSIYDATSLTKYYKQTELGYEKDDNGEWKLICTNESDVSTLFSASDIKNLNDNNLGLNFVAVFDYTNARGESNYFGQEAISWSANFGEISSSDYYYPNNIFSGFADAGADFIKENSGLSIIGEYPKNSKEIAITDYFYQCLKFYGYTETDENGNTASTTTTVHSESDIIGKYLVMSNSNSRTSFPLKVTGIVKVEGKLYNDPQFVSLKNIADKKETFQGKQTAYEELVSSFSEYLSESFHKLVFVSSDFYDAYKSIFYSEPSIYISSNYAEYGTLTRPYKESSDEPEGFVYINETSIAGHEEHFSFYSFDKDSLTATKQEAPILSKQNGKYNIYLPFYDAFDSLGFFDMLNWIHSFVTETVSTYDEFNNEQSSYKYEDAEKFETAYQKYGKGMTNEDVDVLLDGLRYYLDNATQYDENGGETPIDKEAFFNKYLEVSGKNGSNNKQYSFNVVGFYLCDAIDNAYYPLISSAAIDEYELGGIYSYEDDYKTEYKTDYVVPADAKYNYAMSLTDNSIAQTKYCLTPKEDFVTYKMTNCIYTTTYFMASLIASLRKIFIIVAAVVGVLAALLLFNFISISIAAKQREIGILRAIGARELDVFRIFFSEGGFIAMVCFAISSVVTGFVCSFINKSTYSSAFQLKLLEYGIKEVLLIFVVSIVVSLIATIIPVAIAAKKPPVESIRSL